MQDDLMRLFNSGLAESMMTRAGFPEDMPLESKIVTRGIQSAQSQVEARNFEIRKNVLKYDDVMSRQRVVIYEQRRRVLEGEDLHEQVTHFRSDVLSAYITGAAAEGRPEDWDLDALWTALRAVYPVSITPEEVIEQAGGATRLSAELIEREILSDAAHAYAEREEQIGSENMRQLERRVTLSVLDRKWREHLYEMDYLKEGIGLRAMAQRDPLVEYQREGYDMFVGMLEGLKEESVCFLFNVTVEAAHASAVALIAWVEFRESGGFADVPTYVAIFSVFAAIIGSVSFWGSNIAFAKLQELIPGRPISIGPAQQPVNFLLLAAAVACGVAIVAGAHNEALMLGLLVAAAILGNFVVLPI